MDLNGRHVVVTGAAGGIGKALAQRFHAAGARVVAADLNGAGAQRTAEELNAVRDGSALGVAADVGTEAGNVALIGAADDAFGQIDLFFANAGVGTGADLDTPESVWETAFAVNTQILPHPEAATYVQRKATDVERWLGGMRKLQARISG